MSGRSQNGVSYVQGFDKENRLTSVTTNGQTTHFKYDANGQRTMTLAPSGLYTFYPFPNVEEEVNLNNQDYTLKYTYNSAGVAVAVRTKAKQGTTTTNTLHYLYSDHLGSTSTVTNASGGQVQQTRFLPFGGYWGTPTQTVTDRGYTGHLHNDEVGLIYMNARFYVPSIGRFASADTIVPNPTNPQAFNRYSYVKNNPLNRVDPTGHVDCSMLGDESDIQGCQNPTLHLLPPTPPKGVSNRPYGSEEIKDSGPGGKQAWEALDILQESGGWWGDVLDSEEAMILVLNAEFGPLIYLKGDGTWHIPPEIIEAVTRKYNQHCSDGAWSADCFNGFWAYMQSITDVAINKNQIGNLANHPNYYDPERMTFYRNLAHSVMHNSKLGQQMANKPSDWANASTSLAVHLESHPQLRYSFYPANSNFTVYTRGQYDKLNSYRGCLSSGKNDAQTCLDTWLGN